MKVEQRRTRLKPEDIYALAHKDVPKREALDRLNGGDKTTLTYTNRPSPHKTLVNAGNADATADPSTAEPTDTSINAVGQPQPLAKKTTDPGFKPPPSNQPVWFRVSSIGKNVKRQIWTTVRAQTSVGVPGGVLSKRINPRAPL